MSPQRASSKESNVTDKILARTPHKRKRPSLERGLPEEAELAKLATEYLIRQRKLWPKLVEAGLLPEPSPKVVAAMVADFQARHRTGDVSLEDVAAFAQLVEYLAGSYGRYSCDNSKPVSIIDQTCKNLDKAAMEGRFIPWAYVFADYSVSGLTAARQGYSSYKRVLKVPRHSIETTYIDDFTRASRDAIEWWRLAHFILGLKRRLIGSSDGFDLNSPQGELMVGIYGVLAQLFSKSLRQKVKRGMGGAAERGTVLGKLIFWLNRRVRQDEHGRDLLNPDGSPVTEPCIWEEGAELMREIIRKFMVDKWSILRIVKDLNQRKVDDWDRWTVSGLRKLLSSETLIGVFIWNRFSSKYDPEKERYVRVENPRSEWKTWTNPALAIITKKEFRELQHRIGSLKKSDNGNRKSLSRNEAYASTLFSGTLICGYCQPERELTLSRSGKYKFMYCPNGPSRIGNCELTTNKSVRIIEATLLEYLKERILTDENVARLVSEGNGYLAELASRPPVKLKPLNAEIRRLREKIRRLVLDAEDEEDARVRADYRKRSTEG